MSRLGGRDRSIRRIAWASISTLLFADPVVAGVDLCAFDGTANVFQTEGDQSVACQSSEQGSHCQWIFGHKSPEAQQKFQTLRASVQNCDDILAISQDTPVNHPDSYTAWLITYPGADVTLSIKDKAALSKTLVTWRWSARD